MRPPCNQAEPHSDSMPAHSFPEWQHMQQQLSTQQQPARLPDASTSDSASTLKKTLTSKLYIDYFRYVLLNVPQKPKTFLNVMFKLYDTNS